MLPMTSAWPGAAQPAPDPTPAGWGTLAAATLILAAAIGLVVATLSIGKARAPSDPHT